MLFFLPMAMCDRENKRERERKIECVRVSECEYGTNRAEGPNSKILNLI